MCPICNERTWPGTSTVPFCCQEPVDCCIVLELRFACSVGLDLVLEEKNGSHPTATKQFTISDPTLPIAHPFIFWAIPLLDNECKRGREAANKCNNMRSLTAPCKGLAKAKFRYKIEFVSFHNIYWNPPLLNNDPKQGRQEYNESMSSEGEQQFLLECGLLPKSVLCGPSQSHVRLRGSVRIFRDSRIVPNVVLEVIYPRSTGASLEPCGSRNLACSSYGKLRYLRSSSSFQAIRQFAVDNETATITTTATITGASSAAANDATISKQVRGNGRASGF